MLLICAHSGTSGGVTFCQLLPASRETWIRPSSEPHQSTPFSCGDSRAQKIVQQISTPVLSLVIGPPDGACLDLSLRVRSGLIGCQDWPSSVVLKSTLPPA